MLISCMLHDKSPRKLVKCSRAKPRGNVLYIWRSCSYAEKFDRLAWKFVAQLSLKQMKHNAEVTFVIALSKYNKHCQRRQNLGELEVLQSKTPDNGVSPLARMDPGLWPFRKPALLLGISPFQSMHVQSGT